MITPTLQIYAKLLIKSSKIYSKIQYELMDTQLRKERDNEICTKFSQMTGTITARVEQIARETGMAVISIRYILRREKLIGRDKA